MDRGDDPLLRDPADEMVVYDPENRSLLFSAKTVGMSDQMLIRLLHMGVAQSLLLSARERRFQDDEEEEVRKAGVEEFGFDLNELRMIDLGFRKIIVHAGEHIGEIGDTALNHSLNKLFTIMFALLAEGIEISHNIQSFDVLFQLVASPELELSKLVSERDNYCLTHKSLLLLYKDFLDHQDGSSLNDFFLAFASGKHENIKELFDPERKTKTGIPRLFKTAHQAAMFLIDRLQADIIQHPIRPVFPDIRSFSTVILDSSSFSLN